MSCCGTKNRRGGLNSLYAMMLDRRAAAVGAASATTLREPHGNKLPAAALSNLTPNFGTQNNRPLGSASQQKHVA
jgi:hypothetical protein